VKAAREANAAMPAYAVGLLIDAFGDLKDTRVVVLGAAYRGGVKETAFSGVFPLADLLTAQGAKAVVHDPLYSDEELAELGLTPYHLGEPADAAIVQTDHGVYAALTPDSLPGVKVLLDGRRITDPELWHGVDRRLIGAPG